MDRKGVAMATKWFESHDELVWFAAVLTDAGEFPEAADLLRFFEKPWKWTPEHDEWARLGRPSRVDDPDLLRAS